MDWERSLEEERGRGRGEREAEDLEEEDLEVRFRGGPGGLKRDEGERWVEANGKVKKYWS